MHVAAAGDNALLVELGDVTADELHACADAARALEGVAAVIPGYSSLYVVVEASSLRVVEEDVRNLNPRRVGDSATRRLHTLRVSFAREHAPDLDELLARTGMPFDAFLSRVATLRLTARYLGFRGGFAYLDGWPDEWSMPRRPTSRGRVPAGTFAIAGSIAGFYPVDSPGGWNLIGRTDGALAYAIAAGDEIAIVPTAERLDITNITRAETARSPLDIPQAEVLSAPLAIRVEPQDWSLVAYGAPPGGPFDDVAAALAARAVHGDVTLLECASVGPRLRFRRDAVSAWCGPDAAVQVRHHRGGDELSIGRITGGLRGYLAIGNAEGVAATIDRGERHVIVAIRGPHQSPIGRLDCEVTPRLDRVGIRLRPLNAPHFDVPPDLPSCGMQCGTVQLHPDGSVVAMGPDHPVTGGYLQPMTVIASERWKLAQLVPGERVTFLVQPPI